jgi:thiosulfate/3-mercaptopyruvate sulfurtransferase
MSREHVLVDTAWVAEHGDDRGVVLVEVDEDTSAYDLGHIGGAIRIDWKRDLQHPVKRDFIDREAFQRLMSAKGIANDDIVVLYGGNNNWFAAYAYWYFKIYGHADVRLLDGGRKKWELEGRPFSTALVERPETAYRPQEADDSVRAFRHDVIDRSGGENIVDVRSPEEFTGKILAPAHFPQEQPQVRGRVPGAINIPWSKAANEDGTFRSDEELRALYADAGLDADKSTIVYCRIGERSAHTWFVLHELLGLRDVRNHDGSWVEYGSLVGAPVEI